MKNIYRMSVLQIKEAGIDALIKKLGLVGFIRFMNQYTMGSGNYTEEREKLFKQYSLDDIKKEIKTKVVRK